MVELTLNGKIQKIKAPTTRRKTISQYGHAKSVPIAEH